MDASKHRWARLPLRRQHANHVQGTHAPNITQMRPHPALVLRIADRHLQWVHLGVLLRTESHNSTIESHNRSLLGEKRSLRKV